MSNLSIYHHMIFVFGLITFAILQDNSVTYLIHQIISMTIPTYRNKHISYFLVLDSCCSKVELSLDTVIYDC
jgi:hypothetical protein